MYTSIQVSNGLRNELAKRKLYDAESYEEVIWNLIEDLSELNEETKKELETSRQQAANGEVYSLDEVKKRLKIT